jgi:hypothetical protein
MSDRSPTATPATWQLNRLRALMAMVLGGMPSGREAMALGADGYRWRAEHDGFDPAVRLLALAWLLELLDGVQQPGVELIGADVARLRQLLHEHAHELGGPDGLLGRRWPSGPFALRPDEGVVDPLPDFDGLVLVRQLGKQLLSGNWRGA